MEQITETIRKLIIARDRAVNENEAANAAGIISRLLLKHNLDESSVQLEEDPLTSDTVGLGRKRLTKWHLSLCAAVARGTLCSGMWSQCGGIRYHFFGTRSNIQSAKYLFEMLKEQITHIAKEKQKNWDFTTQGPKQGKGYWDSWYHGCVATIKERLIAARQEATQGSQGYELVLVGKERQALAYRNSIHPRLHNTGPTRLSRRDGFQDGKQAGHSVSLARGALSGGQRQICG